MPSAGRLQSAPHLSLRLRIHGILRLADCVLIALARLLGDHGREFFEFRAQIRAAPDQLGNESLGAHSASPFVGIRICLSTRWTLSACPGRGSSIGVSPVLSRNRMMA